MTSKLRKQSLQPRSCDDEEKPVKHTFSSTTTNNEANISDSYSVQPGSSRCTQNHEGEELAFKIKISSIRCCEKDFEKKFGFRNHIRTKHPSNKEELRLCLKCNTMVKATATALIIHNRRKHLADTLGNCVIADDEFLNKNCSASFLKASSKLAQKNSMTFTCKICKKFFLDKKLYKVHQKSHEEKATEKNVYFKKCLCGVTFYEARQYESHWHFMHSGNYIPFSIATH